MPMPKSQHNNICHCDTPQAYQRDNTNHVRVSAWQHLNASETTYGTRRSCSGSSGTSSPLVPAEECSETCATCFGTYPGTFFGTCCRICSEVFLLWLKAPKLRIYVVEAGSADLSKTVSSQLHTHTIDILRFGGSRPS